MQQAILYWNKDIIFPAVTFSPLTSNLPEASHQNTKMALPVIPRYVFIAG